MQGKETDLRGGRVPLEEGKRRTVGTHYAEMVNNKNRSA